jgi:CHAT domain-containing protein/Tfp pilus assembly protein PilF
VLDKIELEVVTFPRVKRSQSMNSNRSFTSLVRRPVAHWSSLALILSAGFAVGMAQTDGNGNTLDRPVASRPFDSGVQVEPIAVLEFGKPVERDIAGGSKHLYNVGINSNEFIYLVVDQRGVDVVVRLYTPEGALIREVDSPNGTQGPEPLSYVSSSGGMFRLEVAPVDPQAPAGRYEVKIAERRPATSTDRTLLVEAETAYEDAAKLLTEKTKESREKAIVRFTQALSLWRAAGEHWREADTLNNLGLLHSLLGDNTKAMASYKDELAIREQLADDCGSAKVLTNIGGVYNDIDDYRTALDYYGRAMELRRRFNNPGGMADTLNNIGVTLQEMGDTPKALETFEKALEYRRTANDLPGEAQLLSNIATARSELGEYQDALDMLNRALDIFKTVPEPEEEADARLSIGRIYINLGEREEAIANFQEALRIATKAGSLRLEATALHNIGAAYLLQSQTDKALEFLNRALEVERQVGDRMGQGITRDCIARIYTSQGKYAEALDLSMRSLNFMREMGNAHGEAIVLNRIGRIYGDLGESDRAQKYFKEALSLSTALGDRATEAGILYSRAKVDEVLGRLPDALSGLTRALNIVESLRTDIANQKLRDSYSTSVREFYDLYLDILMRSHRQSPSKNYDIEALHVSERSRARSLLEMLAQAQGGIRPDVRRGVEPGLLDREHLLERKINAALERQVRLLSTTHSTEEAKDIATELERLGIEYDQVEASIHRSSPAYSSLKVPIPLDAKEIQHTVIDDESILLEYGLGQERAYLWVITKESMNSFELASSLEDIKTAAQTVISMLMDKGGTVSKFESAAANLTKILIPSKAAVQVRLKKRILVVPDGILQHVPFGALSLDASSRGYSPLLADYDLVMLPSASTIRTIRESIILRRPAAGTVAVFADPVFSDTDDRVHKGPLRTRPKAAHQDLGLATGETDALARIVARSKVDRSTISLPRLASTRKEAEIISNLVPDARVHLDFDANLNAVLDPETNHYRILHFATHGFAPDGHPEWSGIVLSLVDTRGESQDGYLGISRVTKLALPTDMVVLSACDTAIAKDAHGEGLIGLARGFMYAGVPRVVATLWPVREDAAVELMRRFYTAMFQQRLSPALALRTAQTSMWKQGSWAPSDWAAFIFSGEWQ